MATNNSVNISAGGVVGYDAAGTFNGSAVTQHSLLLGGANNHTINSLGVATNGQLPIGSGSADPVLATLTAGTGVTVANGAGSITINAVGSGLSWTVITGASQAMSVNNGYIANRSGTVAFTLPTTSAVGDIVAVTGMNTALGWSIAYTTNQQIFFGTSSATLSTGSLASTNIRDTVYLVCIVANLTWNVVGSIGNITVA